MPRERNRVAVLELVGIAVIVIVVAAVLAAFLGYLRFCEFVVVHTGGTAGLRDVAVAIRAFAAVSGSMRAVIRMPWKKS